MHTRRAAAHRFMLITRASDFAARLQGNLRTVIAPHVIMRARAAHKSIKAMTMSAQRDRPEMRSF